MLKCNVFVVPAQMCTHALQPPLLSKFLFFLHAVLGGFWGLQHPLLSKNLASCTHADSTPPLVESAESGQHRCVHMQCVNGPCSGV